MPEVREIMPKDISCPVSAKAVMFFRKKKILLLLKQNGQWDLPGGKLKSGESWLQGLSREVQEESGVALESAAWLSGGEKVNNDNKKVFMAFFVCELNNKPKKSDISISNEHVDAGFFTLKEIAELSISDEFIHMIDLAAVKIDVSDHPHSGGG